MKIISTSLYTKYQNIFHFFQTITSKNLKTHELRTLHFISLPPENENIEQPQTFTSQIFFRLTFSVKCDNSGEEIDVDTSFSVKLPQNAADIVIAVDVVSTNEKIYKQLVLGIVQNLNHELSARGITWVYKVSGCSTFFDFGPNNI